MSHIDVDIVDFLLLTVYPVAGLFAVEAVFRAVRGPKWAKLAIQGASSAAFGAAYITLITAHWLTALVLFALAAALFYQAKRAWADPSSTPY